MLEYCPAHSKCSLNRSRSYLEAGVRLRSPGSSGSPGARQSYPGVQGTRGRGGQGSREAGDTGSDLTSQIVLGKLAPPL